MPTEPDCLVKECVSVVSDLVQREMEQFPSLQERDKPSLCQIETDVARSNDVPRRVKASIRSLSEEVWSVFQSMTSFIKNMDSRPPAKALSEDQHLSLSNQKDTHEHSLKVLLKNMRSRFRDGPGVTSEGDRGRKGLQSLLSTQPADTQQDSEGKITELKNRLRDTYKAAEELRVNAREGMGAEGGEKPGVGMEEKLGAVAGDNPALSSLSKVLSELDGLLVLLETDFSALQSCVNADHVAEKHDDDGLWTDSELEQTHGNNEVNDHTCGTRSVCNPSTRLPASQGSEPSVISAMHDSAVSTTASQDDLCQGISFECRVCSFSNKALNRTSSGNLKAKSSASKCEKSTNKAKGAVVKPKVPSATSEVSANRGKLKNPGKRSDTKTEVASASCLQFLTSRTSVTSASSLSADSRSSQNFKKKGTSIKPSQDSALSMDSQQSVTTKVGSNTQAAATKSAKDSRHEKLRDEKSRSRTNTKRSLDSSQKRKSRESSPSDELLPPERRSSVTDLHACEELALPPRLSPAQWDMIPTTSLSCPNITDTANSVRAWSNKIVSSNFQSVANTRQRILVCILYFTVLVVSFMAVCHITKDCAGELMSHINMTFQEMMTHLK